MQLRSSPACLDQGMAWQRDSVGSSDGRTPTSASAQAVSSCHTTPVLHTPLLDPHINFGEASDITKSTYEPKIDNRVRSVDKPDSQQYKTIVEEPNLYFFTHALVYIAALKSVLQWHTCTHPGLPVIVLTPTEFTVDEGRRLGITCESAGKYAGMISWSNHSKGKQLPTSCTFISLVSTSSANGNVRSFYIHEIDIQSLSLFSNILHSRILWSSQ